MYSSRGARGLLSSAARLTSLVRGIQRSGLWKAVPVFMPGTRGSLPQPLARGHAGRAAVSCRGQPGGPTPGGLAPSPLVIEIAHGDKDVSDHVVLVDQRDEPFPHDGRTVRVRD